MYFMAKRPEIDIGIGTRPDEESHAGAGGHPQPSGCCFEPAGRGGGRGRGDAALLMRRAAELISPRPRGR